MFTWEKIPGSPHFSTLQATESWAGPGNEMWSLSLTTPYLLYYDYQTLLCFTAHGNEARFSWNFEWQLAGCYIEVFRLVEVMLQSSKAVIVPNWIMTSAVFDVALAIIKLCTHEWFVTLSFPQPTWKPLYKPDETDLTYQMVQDLLHSQIVSGSIKHSPSEAEPRHIRDVHFCDGQLVSKRQKSSNCHFCFPLVSIEILGQTGQVPCAKSTWSLITHEALLKSD